MIPPPRSNDQTGRDYRESRFTQPRDDCPHPEWWYSFDDESAEWEVSEFVASLVRLLQPETVVETGTAWGQTAHLIGRALLANGHGQLWTIESDHQRAEASRLVTQDMPVTLVEGSSLDWDPPGPIDLLWLDSAIDIRVREYLRFAPYLSLASIVAVHDAGPQHGILSMLQVLPVHWLYLRTPRGLVVGVPKGRM